jgi:hypothetical protein
MSGAVVRLPFGLQSGDPPKGRQNMANNGENGPAGGRGLDAGFSIVLINAVLAGIGGLWTATSSVVITLAGTGRSSC